ncbi:Uncharacterised protein [Mycobacteroides abscessus subsp. abscessus]|nr:Uncharacterised protein [Mycobacteroides abscessus subsp. abscessus]SHW73694.1 Uncharacterised protein [Mycobacteroides abscessus subsp. abscessus]SIK80462.1 Uncharacterised protein [Mycobacteroides abscessus subsp. abscessus]
MTPTAAAVTATITPKRDVDRRSVIRLICEILW